MRKCFPQIQSAPLHQGRRQRMSFQIPILRPERRKTPRKRCSDRGVVKYESVQRGCQVTDISSDGARLLFGIGAPLPLRFKLVLPGGKEVQCLRIWQSAESVGVRFSP